MSQDFKLKFDSMKDSNPAVHEKALQKEAGEENEYYPASGNSRNLCFVWADGKQMFLNYAYLISGELNSENSSIELWFSTHRVSIKGSRIELLFELLSHQILKKITCGDERYQLLNKNSFVVAEIITEKL